MQKIGSDSIDQGAKETDKFWRFVANGGMPIAFVIVVIAHVGNDIFDILVEGLPLVDFLWKVAVEESSRLAEQNNVHVKPHSSAFEAIMDFKINRAKFTKEADNIMSKTDILIKMIKHQVPVHQIKYAVNNFPYLFDFQKSIQKMDELGEDTLPLRPEGGISVPNKQEIFTQVISATCTPEWNAINVKLNEQYVRAESQYKATSRVRTIGKGKEQKSNDDNFSDLTPLMLSKFIRNAAKTHDDMLIRKKEVHMKAKKAKKTKSACNVQAFEAANIAVKIADLFDQDALSDLQIKNIKSKLGNLILEGEVGKLNEEFEKKQKAVFLEIINKD